MNQEIANLSVAGRKAATMGDWSTVQLCADGVLKRDPDAAEGYFLSGLHAKGTQHPNQAIAAFETVLALDSARYDAAIELASQLSVARRNAEVLAVIDQYEGALDNSPLYLNMAASIYTDIGMPERAWPLFNKACDLQPDVDLFQSNRATCAVYVGELDIAKDIYRSLLRKNPGHRRNHYQLARLQRAENQKHVQEMEAILRASNAPESQNIFLYFALGKQYEDLGQWDRAFDYFERAGNAVMLVANYDLQSDLDVVDCIIETCDTDWLQQGTNAAESNKTPLFITGLPRTGTTLTERIIASHSKVSSVGETEFLQMNLRRESGVHTVEKMSPEMIRAVAGLPAEKIASTYLESISYRLADTPIFIDKLPFNVLYLGFIARAWPGKPIVLLQRNPMDACFSMFKQVFTWAYKYSYSLENLGRYYVAYERLCQHWIELLGEQLVRLNYEELVSDQERQTRQLLDAVGLPFEEACLNFEQNTTPSSTASSIQVRQKIHTGSVGRWKHYEAQLQPLQSYLESNGISTE